MKKFASIILAIFVLYGCRKEQADIIPDTTRGKVTISLGYHIDNQPLIFDSLMYTNAAGNKYSVTKLQYYLSKFRFYKNNKQIFSSDTIIYADAQNIEFSTFAFVNIPAGNYDSIAVYIGLDESQNISFSLPATQENINMNWPDVMGGGYHFLKLEGHLRDSNNTLGYAMHIGKNGFVIAAGAKYNINIKNDETLQLNMRMNINEWFRTPNTYDLNTDGVYSMGNALLMKKLSENGQDVFTIK